MTKRINLSVIIIPLLLIVLALLSCQQQPEVTSPEPEPPAPAPTLPVPSPTPNPQPPSPTPPAPTPKEVELKYDGGPGRELIALGLKYGYITDFLPPATPFTIKKVRIVGGLYGTGWEGKSWTVAIWDEDYQLLHLETRPVDDFAINTPTWAEIEMPDIQVDGKFYVHVYTGTGRLEGIHISADDSVVNEHSDVTVETDGHFKISTQWPFQTGKWFDDKSKVNWKIRAVGTIMPSE